MEETSLPINRLSLSKATEDLNPVIEKAQDEDDIIAKLHDIPEWQVLKTRIERKMKSLEDATRITQSSVADIDDMAIYGYKCMAKDLLIDAYQGIIDDVENTFKVLKAKEDEQGTKQ